MLKVGKNPGQEGQRGIKPVEYSTLELHGAFGRPAGKRHKSDSVVP